MTTPSEVLALARESGAQIVDLRFCDLPGLMQHFSVPISELSEQSFEDGFGFDGSSIRGFQEIQESDMLLVPDPGSAFVDPFTEHPTLSLICNIVDPITKERYTRDPRAIAFTGKKAASIWSACHRHAASHLAARPSATPASPKSSSSPHLPAQPAAIGASRTLTPASAPRSRPAIRQRSSRASRVHLVPIATPHEGVAPRL